VQNILKKPLPFSKRQRNEASEHRPRDLLLESDECKRKGGTTSIQPETGEKRGRGTKGYEPPTRTRGRGRSAHPQPKVPFKEPSGKNQKNHNERKVLGGTVSTRGETPKKGPCATTRHMGGGDLNPSAPEPKRGKGGKKVDSNLKCVVNSWVNAKRGQRGLRETKNSGITHLTGEEGTHRVN